VSLYTVYKEKYLEQTVVKNGVGGIMFIILLLQATKQFPTLYTHHIPFFLNIIVSFLLLPLSFHFITVYFIPYVKRLSSEHSYAKPM
jgi:hypothetical protein